MKRFVYFVSALLLSAQAYAGDPVTVNNQNNGNSNTPSCSNNADLYKNNTKPGVYSTQNSQGGTDTTYTTGDKTPYYVDNNCGNSNASNIAPAQPIINLPQTKSKK